MAFRLLVVMVVSLGLIGCTTSLTNMAPARTFDVGEGQVSVGYQFDVHTQTFTGLYKAGEVAVDKVRETPDGESITEEDMRTLFDAALLWRLFPFGGGPELMGRLGVYDDLLEGVDVGFRLNGNVYKGDVRIQVWESVDEAQALSVQFGYGHHKSVVSSWMEWVSLTEWKRRDFDFQVNYGVEFEDYVKLYVAPRYIHTRVSTEPKLSDFFKERLPEQYRDWDPGAYFAPAAMHYLGLNAGGMVGYRWVFVNFDVSAFHMIFRPTVLGSVRDYDGWVLSPTLGLTLIWN
jgi:hypothetical protein